MTTNLTGDSINVAVRTHEVTADAWAYRDVAATCHQFFDIFNREFFDDKPPTCFLQFGRTQRDNLGHYRPGLNAVEARREINLNTMYLGRSLQEVLCTLLHEMAHEWQELFGRSGSSGYHNKEFTRKCESLGIPCTGGYRSYTIGQRDPFISVLRRHGIDAVVTLPIMQPADTTGIKPARRRSDSSKLKKWSCSCTNIRAAVEVHAVCESCGGRFCRS